MKDTSNSFGANLKALRKKAGLTQPELAYLIGVHETTIRAWELNDRLPKSGYIKRLAEALHVSEQQLLSPDREAARWVLTIKVAQDLGGEVINLSKGIPSISSIAYTPEGGVLTLGGSFDMLADDDDFSLWEFFSEYFCDFLQPVARHSRDARQASKLKDFKHSSEAFTEQNSSFWVLLNAFNPDFPEQAG